MSNSVARPALVLPLIAALAVGACATAQVDETGRVESERVDADSVFGKGLTRHQAQWLRSTHAQPAGR